MRVYAGMDPRLPLSKVAAHAERVEACGYDGLHVPETIHDGLVVSALALAATSRITVRTAVTLAFVRSPTLVAYTAWGLSTSSGGRFELGLGTQIRQNIEERYGMPWGEPVGRLREYVAVVHALYDAFRTGEPPSFVGVWYRVTRMLPYFNPGPDDDTVVPPTWIGGVGPAITEVAGEVADGLVTHPTNSSPRFLRERCLPHLRAAGRDVALVAGVQSVAGPDAAAVARERERQRRLFAMLYSTPAYAITLELYGWDELGPRLRQLIRDAAWDDLPALVTDEVLDTIQPTGTYDELPAILLDRYDGLVDGLVFPLPNDPAHDGAIAEVVRSLSVLPG